jgi:hypothetical protein
MNARIKELAERRECLVAQSELDRERAARSAEHVAGIFSKNTLGRALKSSVGTVAGLLVFRWASRKLAAGLGKLLGRKVVQFATGFWRRPQHR